MPKRLSRAAVLILSALAQGARYGFEIMERTGLTSATVYPTLGKLEDAGFIVSTWEHPAHARREKRPPRRYYALRAAGRKALAAEIAHERAALNLMGLRPRVEPAGD